MYQFNEEFERRYMIPLLQEMLTDMAATPEEAEKGQYLKKLLVPAQLDPRDINQFRIDYFAPSKTATRPFCEGTTDDLKKQEKILKDLAEAIRTRIQLSGPSAMRAAFLPSKDQQFGSNKELTKQVYQLAYNITLGFERDRISEKIKSGKKEEEMSVEEKKKYLKLLEDLENGKLRVIEINGQEQIMTEDEVNAAAKNPAYGNMQVIPMVESGLWGNLEKAIEQNAPIGDKMPTLSGAAPGKGAVVQSSVAGLQKDERQRKASAVKKTLEEAGLKVINKDGNDGEVEVDENGKAHAMVMDKNGQKLNVDIDTNLPDDDARKYTFRFEGGALDGKSFSLSQKDLKPNFKDENGQSRSAEDVYKQKLDAEKLGGGAKPLATAAEGGPNLPLVPGAIPPVGLPGMPVNGSVEVELPPSGFHVEGEIPRYALRGRVPGAKPNAAPQEGIMPANFDETMGEAKIRMPLTGTVMDKKRQVAQKPRVAPPQLRVQAPAQGPAFGSPTLAGGAPAKRKVPAFIKGVIGAGVGAGAGIGAGAYWAATTNPEGAKQAFHFILACLGAICLA